MCPDFSASAPAMVLMAPVLRTIGMWTARYVLLSLFLALIWIAVVSIGQSYSRRALGTSGRTLPRPVILTAGFRHWQGENEDVWRELAHAENRLNASGSGQGATPASRSKSCSPPGVET
jgi:hypothetical protein